MMRRRCRLRIGPKRFDPEDSHCFPKVLKLPPIPWWELHGFWANIGTVFNFQPPIIFPFEIVQSGFSTKCDRSAIRKAAPYLRM
jgi:hypothetical protein